MRRISVAIALALLATSAPAQDYPARPITLIVPYAAGGGNDVMARIVAERMSRTLGQQIVIENQNCWICIVQQVTPTRPTFSC